MSEEVKTKVLRLELLADQVQAFRALQKALGHDEPEQTFERMLELLRAALVLTSKEQPTVRLYNRDFSKAASRLAVCPQCNHSFTPPISSENDGFREMVVDLT